jgi:hypothetical protein
VTVRVQDSTISSSSPASLDYELAITDVNAPPAAVILTPTTVSLNENTATYDRLKLAEIAITDDIAGSNTISLSGADAAFFEANSTGLYLIAGTTLDYEVQASYAVTVSVADAAVAGSQPVTAAFTLQVNDVNEAPQSIGLADVTTTLPENTATSSRVRLADVVLADDGLGVNTIRLGGADIGHFEVDATGLYLRQGEVLDFETQSSYSVTVRAFDQSLAGIPPVTTSFTLGITDINEAPTALAFTEMVTSLPEGTDTTTRVKLGNVVVVDDALGTNLVTLAGSDTNLLEIDGGSLYLKAGTTLDFEAQERLTISVAVSDEGIVGSTPATRDYSLTIEDVNEAPSAVEIINAITTLPENTYTSNGIKVADIKVTDDASGANTITLSGNDAAFFAVSQTGLYLRAAAGLDFEQQPTLDVSVNVLDTTIAGSAAVTAHFSMTVTDINESPTGVALTNVIAGLPENSDTAARIRVADIVVTDDALGSVTVQPFGTDAASFEIEAGVLYVRSGVSLDYESLPTLTVDVQAFDLAVVGGRTVTTTLGLAVTDVNEAPTAVVLPNPVPTLFEGVDTTSRVKVADIEVTDDAPGSNAISLSGEDADLFEADATGLYLRAGTKLDFETKPTLSVTVEVADASIAGSTPVSQSFSLLVGDSNEAPTGVAVANRTAWLSDAADTSAKTKLADIVITDDARGNNAISLTGPDAAAFEADGGVLYLKAGVSLDATIKDAYAVTISVSDPEADDATQAVTTEFHVSVLRLLEGRGAVSLGTGVGGTLSAGGVPITFDSNPLPPAFRAWEIVEADKVDGQNILYGRHTSGHLHRLPADESWALYGMERIGNAASIVLPSRPTPVSAPSALRAPIELNGSVGLFRDGLGQLYAATLTASSSNTPIPIRRGGVPLTQSPQPGYQVLAAAIGHRTYNLPLLGTVTDETNQLLVRHAQGIELWDFDEQWNMKATSGPHALDSTEAIQAEIDFGIDLNRDGVIDNGT